MARCACWIQTVALSLLPELPTIAEQGVPGYEAVLRYGLVAPAGTPRSVIDKLNKELNAALAHDDVRTRFCDTRHGDFDFNS